MPNGHGVESWVQWAFGLVAMAFGGLVAGVGRAWQHVNRRLSEHVAEMHRKLDMLRVDVSKMKEAAGRVETKVDDHERRLGDAEDKAEEVVSIKATIEAMQRTLDRIDGKLS